MTDWLGLNLLNLSISGSSHAARCSGVFDGGGFSNVAMGFTLDILDAPPTAQAMSIALTAMIVPLSHSAWAASLFVYLP
jgi:hypothetical protein